MKVGTTPYCCHHFKSYTNPRRTGCRFLELYLRRLAPCLKSTILANIVLLRRLIRTHHGNLTSLVRSFNPVRRRGTLHALRKLGLSSYRCEYLGEKFSGTLPFWSVLECEGPWRLWHVVANETNIDHDGACLFAKAQIFCALVPSPISHTDITVLYFVDGRSIVLQKDHSGE